MTRQDDLVVVALLLFIYYGERAMTVIAYAIVSPILAVVVLSERVDQCWARATGQTVVTRTQCRSRKFVGEDEVFCPACHYSTILDTKTTDSVGDQV